MFQGLFSFAYLFACVSLVPKVYPIALDISLEQLCKHYNFKFIDALLSNIRLHLTYTQINLNNWSALGLATVLKLRLKEFPDIGLSVLKLGKFLVSQVFVGQSNIII